MKKLSILFKDGCKGAMKLVFQPGIGMWRNPGLGRFGLWETGRGLDLSGRDSLSGNCLFGAERILKGRFSRGCLNTCSWVGVALSPGIWKRQSHSQALGGWGQDSLQGPQYAGRAGPPSQLLRPYTQPRTHPGWHWPQTSLEGGKQVESVRSFPIVWVTSLYIFSGDPRKNPEL